MERLKRAWADITATSADWRGLLYFGAALIVSALAGLLVPPLRVYDASGNNEIVFNAGVATAAFVFMMLAYPFRIVGANSTHVQRAGWALDGALAGLTLGSVLAGKTASERTIGLILIALVSLLIIALQLLCWERSGGRVKCRSKSAD